MSKSIAGAEKGWPGLTLRKDFIGQNRFGLGQIHFHGRQSSWTGEVGSVIPLEPGLMKAWRRACPGPWRRERGTGGEQDELRFLTFRICER